MSVKLKRTMVAWKTSEDEVRAGGSVDGRNMVSKWCRRMQRIYNEGFEESGGGGEQNEKQNETVVRGKLEEEEMTRGASNMMVLMGCRGLEIRGVEEEEFVVDQGGGQGEARGDGHGLVRWVSEGDERGCGHVS